MPIATAADVAAKLGRDLTTAEQADVTEAIASAIETIDSELHRAVQLDQWVETREPLFEGMSFASVANGWSSLGYAVARVHLKHRPVSSIVSVVDKRTGTNITAGSYQDGDSVLVPISGPVTVTYTGGDDPPSPVVKRTIIKAIIRELSLPPAIAAGAYNSYSVEGSSFEANRPADTDTYPFNGTEMRALKKTLGRLVLR